MTSASARPMDEWFRQWVESLAQDKAIYDEDTVALRYKSQLIKIDGNPNIRRRLRNIYASMLKNNLADAEQRLRQFLVSACIWQGEGSKAKPYRAQKSLRKRELSELAKSARTLAYRIKESTIFGAVDFGTERIEFLKNRMCDPRAVFPPADPTYNKDYSYNSLKNPSPATLSSLIDSFAAALDAQAKRDSPGQVHRVTNRNQYVDTLASYCGLVFGGIDYKLVAMVTSEVTGKPVTESMVRKRTGLGVARSTS